MVQLLKLLFKQDYTLRTHRVYTQTKMIVPDSSKIMLHYHSISPLRIYFTLLDLANKKYHYKIMYFVKTTRYKVTWKKHIN